MNCPSDFVDKVLIRVANKLNIKKWRYEIQNLSGNIVNYLGNLVPVSLIDESSDVIIHLMIKAFQSSVPEIESVVDGAYKREVYFYLKLLPLFKNNIYNSEAFFPVCYYADSSKGNRVIVMQNMAVKGFQRHEEGRFLDQDHLTLTLKAVARLHSFSLILKEKNIEPIDDQLMVPFSAANEPTYANALQKCFKKYGVHMFEGTKHEEFFNNLYSLMQNMTHFMDKCVMNAHTLVYGHGDLWKENILYKYSDNKPVHVCLLDYQLTRLMSPAYDVLFLIMNSIDSDVRREHYQTFLSTYYKVLERSLRADGIDPRKVYSEENFHDDIQLVFPFCFSITLFSYVLWLGLENLISILDVSGTVNEEQQKDEIISFKKIIGDLITDFGDFGLISI